MGVNRAQSRGPGALVSDAVAVTDGTVCLRVLGSAPAAAVAEPVLFALGARAGLEVSRLDEMAMALGLAVRRAGRPLLIELTPGAGWLTVAVRPLEPRGLRECRDVLSRLVGTVEVEGDGEGLVMRAG
jgi:hypothetical protein